MQMSDQEYSNITLEIQKTGLLKRWWINIFTPIGRTPQNQPIIYREYVEKYKDVYLTSGKTKEELDLLLIEVLRSSLPSQYMGTKVVIMDSYKVPYTEVYVDNGSYYYRVYTL